MRNRVRDLTTCDGERSVSCWARVVECLLQPWRARCCASLALSVRQGRARPLHLATVEVAPPF